MKNMKAILSPSLLSADFANLGSEVAALEKAGISWLHLDVMDGSFAPNITFGQPLIKSLRKHCALFFDAHLMIEGPERYIANFAEAGADLVVLHVETLAHGQKALAQIHECGMKAGIALNPGTDFSACRWLLPHVDMILLMGVNPGFSGQAFIPETCAKVRACRAFLQRQGFGSLPIQVDGGVNLANTPELANAGANILVSGSAFFGYDDYSRAAGLFYEAAEKAVLDEATAEALEISRQWKRAGSK